MEAEIHCNNFILVILVSDYVSCMNNDGLMVGTSDSRWCNQGSSPRRGVYEFAYQLFK